MQVLKLAELSTETVIKQAIIVLKNGGLIIFPTETTYGAGVIATDQAAVNKLLEYKTRREGKPLSIAVCCQEMAEQYVELNVQAKTLYQQFLPGPITVISTGKHQLAAGVESEFGTLGVRIPDYPLLLELIKTLGQPITATSANASGKKRPYSIPDLLDRLSEKQKNLIDLIIDAGQLPNNPPSTVIDTTHSTPVVFRQGKVNIGAKPTIQLESTSANETKKIAGKLLLKHQDKLKHSALIFGLNGPLGAGKTVFAQGIAEYLQISAPVVSPTYSYIEEYHFSKNQLKGTLYHADVWKVDSEPVFNKLEFEQLLKPGNVLIIEWYSQVQAWLAKLIKTKKAAVVEVAIRDLNQTRLLEITETKSI